MKLVLFDIDGTILTSDGAGRRAMQGALTHVFGDCGPHGYHYDGKTDPQIARDLMRLSGHDDARIDALLPRLMARYLEGLVKELEGGALRLRVLPGVRALLDALEVRADVLLGLLTGNIDRGATIKLRAAGIDPARFRVGAFGSDHAHRPELPGIAQRKARESLGIHIDGGQIVVIGDTPSDIECGRAIGARAIAVATGRYDVAALRACRPFAVFPDLSEVPSVMEAIVRA
ncbi:MAG: haloacid dehalogenase-like hydrolase [Gemmatimonadota bacterium]|nr:haloacid dehalogenase-like hydrolase [Gemmatimonadota bacterium]